MKAIALSAFGSADNFREADLPIPQARKGEVRIKVKAASFNPVDYQICNGQKTVGSGLLESYDNKDPPEAC